MVRAVAKHNRLPFQHDNHLSGGLRLCAIKTCREHGIIFPKFPNSWDGSNYANAPAHRQGAPPQHAHSNGANKAVQSAEIFMQGGDSPLSALNAKYVNTHLSLLDAQSESSAAPFYARASAALIIREEGGLGCNRALCALCISRRPSPTQVSSLLYQRTYFKGFAAAARW